MFSDWFILLRYVGQFGEIRIDALLPTGSSFSSYDGQTYGTANAVVTIMAPEPATMILFGIGGLCLLRMKRAQKKV